MKKKKWSQTSWFTKQWQSMTSELFFTGGFKKPSVRKSLFENYYEREKGLHLKFQKHYDSMWLVTTEICSIKLGWRGSKRDSDTIFIYHPFHEALCRENSNEIKYPLTFVQDCCDLRSQPLVKVNFDVVDVPQAPKNDMALYSYICIL